jgi:iron complex outermembrane receptor protein
MVTVGGFAEDRSAGFNILSTPATTAAPATGPGAAFIDSLSARHGDLGVVGGWRSSPALSFAVRASASIDARRRHFGDRTERDDQRAFFGEWTAAYDRRPNAVVVGVSALGDRSSSPDVPLLDFDRSTASVFAQDSYAPTAWLSATANGRCDRSTAYGTICTPRVSVLIKPASALSARLSDGAGWFAPTPLTDETETFR